MSTYVTKIISSKKLYDLFFSNGDGVKNHTFLKLSVILEFCGIKKFSCVCKSSK